MPQHASYDLDTRDTRTSTRAPVRTARLEAANTPIDLTRWRQLWDRLLAQPVPPDGDMLRDGRAA
jgi:hypothetical protein